MDIHRVTNSRSGIESNIMAALMGLTGLLDYNTTEGSLSDTASPGFESQLRSDKHVLLILSYLNKTPIHHSHGFQW